MRADCSLQFSPSSLSSQIAGCLASFLGLFFALLVLTFEYGITLSRWFIAIVVGSSPDIPLDNTLRWCGVCVHHLVARLILRISTNVTFEAHRPLTNDEVRICVANHVSTLMSPTWAYLFYRYFSGPVAIVAKHDLGWPIRILFRMTGSGILIDRSSSEKTRHAIRIALNRLMARPLTIIIFANKGRADRASIAADWNEFDQKGKNAARTRHIRIPRVGGVHELISYPGFHNPRHFSISSGLSTEDLGIESIFSMFGSTFHMKIKETKFSTNLQVCTEQINRLFLEIDNDNDEWKK